MLKPNRIIHIYSFIFILLYNYLNPNDSYGNFKYQWPETLDVSASVRAVSFARIFTPIADDGTGADYNPAGFAYLQRSYLNMSFLKPKKSNFDLYLGFISYNHPEDENFPVSLAISNKIAFFDNHEQFANKIYISLAKQFLNKVAIGFNINFFYSKFINGDFYVPGIDFGIMTTAIPFIKVGVMLKDIASVKYHPQDEFKKIEKVPTIIKMGLASDFSKFWTIAFEIDKNLDNKDSDLFYGFSSYFLLWEEMDIPYKNEILKISNKENEPKKAKETKEPKKTKETKETKEESESKKDEVEISNVFNTRIFFNAGFNSDKELGLGFTFNVHIFKIDISCAIKEFSMENIYLGLNIGFLLY